MSSEPDSEKLKLNNPYEEITRTFPFIYDEAMTITHKEVNKRYLELERVSFLAPDLIIVSYFITKKMPISQLTSFYFMMVYS